jgi:hypothetical protein
LPLFLILLLLLLLLLHVPLLLLLLSSPAAAAHVMLEGLFLCPLLLLLGDAGKGPSSCTQQQSSMYSCRLGLSCCCAAVPGLRNARNALLLVHQPRNMAW